MAKELPKKLSAGIRAALKDLAAVEASKDYAVDMSTWHAPRFNYSLDAKGNEKETFRECQVCFAGSVMAKTLKVAKNKDACVSEFSKTIRDKLIALDEIRTGDVTSAIESWYGPRKAESILESLRRNPLLRRSDFDDEIEVEVAMYEADPDQWRDDMNRLADALEQLGL